MYTVLGGGGRLEHISKLKESFNIVPGLKIPSPDCLGRRMKQLATETLTATSYTSNKEGHEVVTEYCDNIPMNRMLIKATKRMGGLKEGKKHTLDIDATFLRTERRGAVRKVNKNGKIDCSKIGFSPMVSLIGNMPVYISLRNGDAGARFQLYECLKNTLDLLDESKIRIGRVVSDAAGYNKMAMDMLDSRGIKFNIRWTYNKKMAIFRERLLRWEDWRPTEIETANYFWNCEIADIPYSMHKKPNDTSEDRTYRIVALRIPNDEKRKLMESAEEQHRREQIKELLDGLAKKKILKELQRPYTDSNWKHIEGDEEYVYKFFITNDNKRTAEEIVREYNKRGTSERNFSFLKRDFGWSLPPFMELNENAVFLIAAALANNLYRSYIKLYKKKMPGLSLTSRLKDFIFLVVSVSCEYLGHGVYEFHSRNKMYLQLME